MGNPQRKGPLRASTGELVTGLLQEGHDVVLALTGWSMKPLIAPGSRVRFTAGRSPRRGDIVLVRYPGERLVAHRVIAIDSERVWTKGDACLTADAPVPREQIIGCATWLEAPGCALATPPLRWLGLALSRVYPELVRMVRAVFPRKETAPF